MHFKYYAIHILNNIYTFNSCYIKYMNKSITTKKLFTKKRLLISIPILVILSPLIIFSVYSLIVSPILDKIDHDKFNTLDTQMQSLYAKIKTASNGAEDWKYSAVCSANYTGDFTTGTYDCISSISTEKTISSLKEFTDMHDKYYSITNSSNIFDQTPSNSFKSAGDFSKEFNVSIATKDYAENITKTQCTYDILLNQTESNTTHRNSSYMLGSPIIDGVGASLISIRCDSTARKSWYKTVKTTSNLIP